MTKARVGVFPLGLGFFNKNICMLLEAFHLLFALSCRPALLAKARM